MTVARSAAVLISGGGSNLQALIDASRDAESPYAISMVISNRNGAAGLERAKRAGIPAKCIPHNDFERREDYDAALLEVLATDLPDLVFLAGFMRILTPVFINRYYGRLLNIHPSLLPAFPGLNTHRRVLAAGDSMHGCTVHFVSAELDSGPAIVQGCVPVAAEDTETSLAARVLKVEHEIYPYAASLLATGRLELRGDSVWLDGRQLAEPIRL